MTIRLFSSPRRRTLLAAATAAALALCAGGASAQVGIAPVQRSFINLSFEQPNLRTVGCRVYIDEAYVPGWTTTHSPWGQENSGGCVTPPGFVVGAQAPIIELWHGPRTNGGLTVTARSGDQLAELNAEELSRISQNVCLVPGDDVEWRFSHKGRGSPTVEDRMQFLLGEVPIVQVGTTNTGVGGVATTYIGTSDSVAGPNGWRDYEGAFAYAGSGGVTNIGFEALSGTATTGNFLDDIQVFLKPFIELTGTAFETVEGAGSGAPSLRIVGTLQADLTIDITVTGGTAVVGNDFITPSGGTTFSVVIPAGTYEGDVLVPLGLISVGNALVDGNRTVELSLLPDPDGFLLSSTDTCGGTGRAAAVWTLLDDDLDLAIEKTASVANAAVGDDVNYTLQVSHREGVDGDNAVLRDPAVPGLDCSAATLSCSASSGAVCPDPLTIGALQGAGGVVIPTLPAGGELTIGYSCTVTGDPP